MNPLFSTFREWANSLIYENPFVPFLQEKEDWKVWANKLRQNQKFSDLPEPKGDSWQEWATIVCRLKG